MRCQLYTESQHNGSREIDLSKTTINVCCDIYITIMQHSTTQLTSIVEEGKRMLISFLDQDKISF